MKYEEFKAAAFDYALKSGCGAAELYFVSGEAFEASALNHEIEKYSVSRGYGFNLRVQVNGKNGYAYTEVPDDPKALVRRAMDNAAVIDDSDEQPMQGKSVYPEIEKTRSPLTVMDEKEKIALALKLEEETLSLDKRAARVMQCAVVTGSDTVRLSNTLGLDAQSTSDVAVTYVVPVLEENGVARDGFAFRFGAEAGDISGCAREAVAEAAACFGASAVPAGSYRVLFRSDAMADLLDAFSPMFSAEEAQKGRSLLADKVGKSIANGLVSIVDDPFHPRDPRAFDAEGVPSVKTELIKDGVLTGFLHDLKTAKKAGVASTSNAVRASAMSPVTVGPSNMYIVPGKKSYDELVGELSDGLIITSLAGLHAGVDTVSGEFSLLAKGFLVKGGKIERPVEQITVGGSFITLMQRVTAVGSDFKPSLPMFGACSSPSVLVSELVVAGS